MKFVSHFHIYCTEEQSAAYRGAAKKDGVSISHWIRCRLDDALGLEYADPAEQMMIGLRKGQAHRKRHRNRFAPRGSAERVKGSWGGTITQVQYGGAHREDCQHLRKCETLAGMVDFDRWTCLYCRMKWEP